MNMYKFKKIIYNLTNLIDEKIIGNTNRIHV